MSYTNDRKQKALGMFDDGTSIAEIARQRGMPSEKTIRAWVVVSGRKLRGVRARYPRREIEKLLRKHVPRTEIMERYGCSEKYLVLLARSIKTKSSKRAKRKAAA